MSGAASGTFDKDAAVGFLTSVGAVVHRTLGGAWSGVEAIVATQQDCDFSVPVFPDFALVELCIGGRMVAENKFDGWATGSEGVYRPGALFFFPPKREGECRSHGDSAELLQLVIDNKMLDEVKTEILAGDPDASDLLGFNAVHHPRMRFCAEALHRELLAPSAGGALMAEAMTQALCVEIVRGYSSGRVSSREPAKATLSPAQLDRALDAIEAAVPGDAGLEEIAKRGRLLDLPLLARVQGRDRHDAAPGADRASRWPAPASGSSAAPTRSWTSRSSAASRARRT